MKETSEYYKKRYLANREVWLANAKERYKDPAVRAKKREYDRKRREKQKANGIKAFTDTKREMHYKQRYGITVAEYDKMLSEQKNKCAICGIDASSLKTRLHVDHSHSSGSVRGLLCGECNKGLGQFKDSIELMEKAIKYLKKS